MVNVLLVDDAKFIRARMTDMIQKLNHVVSSEAENGKLAIQEYFRTKPDVVFMDITMPELNGKDALKQILNIDPEAKVIMCSALDSTQLVEECMKIGAKGYIVKPFKIEDVEEVINQALGLEVESTAENP